MELSLCNEAWSVCLTYPNMPFKITFSEPHCFDREQLVWLSMGEKGWISGGGNSCWTLRCRDFKYLFTTSVSGEGEDVSIEIELPYLRTKQYMWNILKLYDTDNCRPQKPSNGFEDDIDVEALTEQASVLKDVKIVKN